MPWKMKFIIVLIVIAIILGLLMWQKFSPAIMPIVNEFKPLFEGFKGLTP